MSHVIVYENDTGHVSVCLPTGELPIEAVLEKDCPSHAFIVEQNSLPQQDSDFFDAWVLDGKDVIVNISEAKELTKNRLRVEREPLMAAQDVLFQRALEEGKDTAAIVAEKSRLRDITNLTDGCTTTAELRALTCAK